jgi:hypothetical protein
VPTTAPGWGRATRAGLTDFRDELEIFDFDPSLNPEHVHLDPSFAEAGAALDAPGPLFDDLWAAGQQQLADESTAGSRETVSGAGHGIQFDQPPAVIDALERILDDLET